MAVLEKRLQVARGIFYRGYRRSFIIFSVFANLLGTVSVPMIGMDLFFPLLCLHFGLGVSQMEFKNLEKVFKGQKGSDV